MSEKVQKKIRQTARKIIKKPSEMEIIDGTRRWKEGTFKRLLNDVKKDIKKLRSK